ncbi:MAG: trypsin-like peptidase domain-containing protein [Clostridiales bacterium]|nr:trypsin-like peptidase domain-containing protein [Clostridiales bacterium]
MENENNEKIKRSKRGSDFTPKEKAYRQALILMAVLLLACVIFSGYQTLYIFRMNTGLEGILTYNNFYNQQIETDPSYVDPIEAIGSNMNSEPSELPEPWFSIEDAASVNKKRLTTVDIVKLVSPATVSLSVVGIDDGKETKIGSGTGFIITEDGYIVTNQHVVVLADRAVSTYYVTVILPDEKQSVRAKVVGSDAQTDIAVLKVDTDRKLPHVTLGDSDNLQAGELAVAIGNAMGTLDDTVTVGVISAPSREINRNGYYVDIIQTDAAINPGNSGGPLINSFGEVIGIINAKIVSSTSENLGFAIRINSVKKIIEDIINYGKVVGRPYLGVSVTYVSADAYFGAKDGVYVAKMVPGGPAEKAGLKIGDIIVTLDGVEIKETGDIIKVRDSHKVGDVIEAVIIRDGKELTRNIVIGDSADANN